ncbi:GntR family transcriptional regulator [Micromonospora inyonensis]|uniref:DNA-binding transcriptional regulator, GntR family n=1 Tax=Micromonospora inyonensis TaxID=47866 RepID=A0A1C6SI92_9ACTN|nr:GntR family transcriptional regulator [Micromonospora inyonensis]SCL29118.1 DNA-binding transcriptional regulator, GntR family [Micromonospora inyonensis]
MKPLSEDASLTERVFEQIRAAIISGELAPGSLYSVVEIASQLGVSRTPVREALLQFAANGMVRFERSRGVRILELSVKDIEEIYSLRLLLEAPSAYRAATEMSDRDRAALKKAFDGMRKACDAGDERLFQRHDLAFHEAIVRAAGNERVVQVVANTRSQMHALGLSTTKTRTLADILAVHEKIYVNIMARDPAGASDAVQDHLIGTLTMLVQQSTDDPSAVENYQPPVRPVRMPS